MLVILPDQKLILPELKFSHGQDCPRTVNVITSWPFLWYPGLFTIVPRLIVSNLFSNMNILPHIPWKPSPNHDVKTQEVWQHANKKLLEDLKAEEILLSEKFAARVLIEKLPNSWNDYKNNLKHKQKTFTIEELVTHILIEDTNRKEFAKEMALKANLVQSNNKSIEVLGKLPVELTVAGGKSSHEVANYVQSKLADALGFECTRLTRRDKHMMPAGNEGLVQDDNRKNP
ncbi:hypothetical protein ACH5RR_028371 [Cinchona calisaya]|uniref:Uncharacterized protein n=1 Tax=Cinchona calisaya TaxID=153742 RepID=A0ABD2YNK0_9GENT